MILFHLAARSLRNRLLTTVLTVLSIALSVALLVGIENVRVGMRQSFSNTISRTDLIVGARGGTTQLLLYSVFGIGSPSQNVSWETYRHFADHPAVAWTIPYSLGDSHRGYRVIGTDSSFYEHFRFRGDSRVTLASGTIPAGARDVTVGSEVARELGYAVGDDIVVTHGMGATGIMDHDERPFRVTGVLRETFTPIDRAVYVTLEGIGAVHDGWESGAPAFGGPAAGMPSFGGSATGEPVPGFGVPPAADSAALAGQTETHAGEDHEITQITAFFVGARSRMDGLTLQREINTYDREAIMAVLPGITLAEMWRSVGYAEDGLKVITLFVVLVGLLGMLVSIYTSLNARRREMAILRAVGAGPQKIIFLLVLEAGLLAVAGALLGVALVYMLLLAVQGPIEQQFGLHIPIRPLGTLEYMYVGAVIAAGFIIGFVPAVKAYRNTLADGLSVRL
jgi:putative ABC transport system permease protein